MPKRPSKSTRPVAALPADYAPLLADIKARVQAARIKAGLAANRELLALYWDLGRLILDRQKQEGWGAKVIDRLSADLQLEFPGQQGFSPRNLKYMRAFAGAWPEAVIVQQAGAQLTSATLSQAVTDSPTTSASIVQQPVRRLRQAKKAKPQSCKRRLHESPPRYRQLCTHRLHNCLGITTSPSSTNLIHQPVDDRFRQAGDQLSIGLILCRTKNRVIAEYALRDLSKPIGVSGYVTKLVESLPKELKGAVPSVEELEREFTQY